MTFRRTLRGATLVEVMLTSALTALIIGTATTLYAFVGLRTADSINRFNTLQSTTVLTRDIGLTIGSSMRVSTKTLGGNVAICCEVPADGMDTDKDGYLETYQPSGTDKLKRETFTVGRRIWYYRSDTTGNPASAGDYWFRAQRTDSADPTVADIDQTWSFENTGVPRVQIPGTVVINNDPTAKLTEVRIQTSGTAARVDGGLTRSHRSKELDLRIQFFWRSN